jgi:hypothetical protein
MRCYRPSSAFIGQTLYAKPESLLSHTEPRKVFTFGTLRTNRAMIAKPRAFWQQPALPDKEGLSLSIRLMVIFDRPRDVQSLSSLRVTCAFKTAIRN